jgi:tetratricopeptide (TPR) repeat protein
MKFDWKRRLPWFIGLGLLLITLAVYWGLLSCAFLNYDDNSYVTENFHVHGGLTLRGLRWAFGVGYAANWHPLTWLSHMADYQLFGSNPRWHHLMNLIFHLANTLLLFGLLRRATGALWPSAMVAALFAWHPVHVESVAWVAERKDLLCTFFFLLALSAYARYGEGRRKNAEGRSQKSEVRGRESAPGNTDHGSRITFPASRCYLLSLGCFALGLMSKPMAVSLPFVLLLLDYWPLRRFELRAGSSRIKSALPLLWEKIPFFALAMVASALTILAQRRGGAVVAIEDLPFAPRCGNALVSYLRYAGKLLWPHDLAVIYPYIYQWPLWLIGGAAGLLLAVSWLALKLRRQAPYLPVGWFWYLGTLVPVIGLVQVGEQAMADRYTYIPSIGFFMVMCWAAPQLLGHWPLRKPALVITAVVALCACARLTRAQAAYWRDSVSLFEHAVAVTRDNYAAHATLGAGLATRNRLDEAIAQYHIALRLKPGCGLAHMNLGLALARLGRYDEAVAQYQSALAINPRDAQAHYNLANAFNPEFVEEDAVAAPTSARRPDIQQARQHYLSTLALDPDCVGARINLGNLEASAGEYDAAIRCYQDALRTDPLSAQAHYNLAATLADPLVKLDQKNELVVKHLREALRLKPDWVEPMNNLAWMLATHEQKEIRNGPDAVRLATRACELTGYKNTRVLGTLDAAYAEAGRFAEAIDTAQKGCELALAAGENELADAARARSKLYQAGKPYHQGDSGAGR